MSTECCAGKYKAAPQKIAGSAAEATVIAEYLSGIGTLKAQGVEKIVFVTKDATSAFRLADLLEKGAAGETYKLTHDGKTAVFTAGGQQTDISDILA